MTTTQFLHGFAVCIDFSCRLGVMLAVGSLSLPPTFGHAAPCSPVWSTKASMNTTRNTLAAAALGGKIYAIAGDGGSTVEAYDPSTNIWTTKASLNSWGWMGPAAATVGGTIYVMGGWDYGGGFTTRVEAYDPATNTWTTKTSMPTARANLSAAVVGGKIYAIGGRCCWDGVSLATSVGLATVEVYDPTTNAWTAKASMPAPQISFGAAVVGGTIYVITGATVQAYDPATNTWTAKSSMPTSRSNLAAAVVDGKIYAIGGYGGAPLATIEVYDPATNTWAAQASMPTARYDLAATTESGTIYVLGGGFASTNEAARPGTACFSAQAGVVQSPLSVGRWVTLWLSVTNGGGTSANGVSPVLQIDGGSGLVAYEAGPLPAGPVIIGPGSATTFVWTYSVSGAGSVSFTATVSGTDAGTGEFIVTSANWSGTISTASQLASAMSVGPLPVPVGQWTQVRLTVTNVGGVFANGVSPVIQITGGSGLVAYETGPLPAGPVTLGPGSSTTFTWTYSVSGAGFASFTATASGTDAGTGNLVVSSASRSGTVSTSSQLASAMSVGPLPVPVGQWTQVRLTVTNVGGLNNVSGVSPVLQIDGGSGLVAYEAGPLPAGPVTLGPGSSTTFVWTYSVSGAGFVSFTATASGTDAGTGNLVMSSASRSGTVSTSSQLASAMSVGPLPIPVGQWTQVRITVTNTGGVNNVSGVSPNIQIDGGSGLVVYEAGPLPAGPVMLGPGSATTFVWTYSVSGAGTVSFTATVSGTDAGTGNLVMSSASRSGTVSTTSELIAVISWPTPWVTVGQWIQLSLTVTNVGGLNNVSGVIPSHQIVGGSGLAVYKSGPLPAGPVTLAPGSATTFVWTYSVSGSGLLSFTASGSGTDDGTGALVIATAGGSAVLLDSLGPPPSSTCPSLSGLIGTIAGTGVAGYNGDGIAATAAQLSSPGDICIDAAGNIYFVEPGSHFVRRIDAVSGMISRVAGTGVAGYNGDGILATSARLNFPQDVAVDASGNIFIADYVNRRIRRVDAQTGLISTIAGTGVPGYNGDGIPATQAELGQPQGVALDAAGRVYIADSSRVRRVDLTTGLISTVAGTGSEGYNGDGIAATSANLRSAQRVGLDGAGNLFIVEGALSHRVRRVDASTNLISTVAGTGGAGYNGDGVAANSALSTPAAIAVDVAGNILIADAGNHRIRRVDAGSGLLSTVAGTGALGFSGDGNVATGAQLNNPYGIASGPGCRMYIADAGNHRIRAVPGGALGAPSTDATGIPLAVYTNLPPAGTIQIRNNVIRRDQAGVAYVVVHGKAAGETVRAVIMDAAGMVLGEFPALELDGNGVGVIRFSGTVDRMGLRTGHYWIVTSGAVAARKPFMVISAGE